MKKIILMTIVLFMLFPLIYSCHKNGIQTKKEQPLIVWPKPPETPKIQFIKSVSTPLDFQIKNGLLQVFFDYLAGKTITSITSPYGVEVDAKGNLFVVDTYLKIVHVFNATRKKYYFFPKNKTSFESPIDLAINNEKGIVYVSDSKDGVVKIFNHLGKEYAGELGRGVFSRPTGLAINNKTSELLVVDTLSSNIFRYNLNDLGLKGMFGRGGTGKGRLHYPTNIFTGPNGTIIVSDSLNFRIQIFSSDGVFQKSFGSAGDNPGYFTRPKGVAMDSEGNIYVVDSLFDNIQIFDKENRLLLAFGNHGKKSGEFWLPTGLFIDQNDRIYVADSYNKRVQIFQFLKHGIVVEQDG